MVRATSRQFPLERCLIGTMACLFIGQPRVACMNWSGHMSYSNLGMSISMDEEMSLLRMPHGMLPFIQVFPCQLHYEINTTWPVGCHVVPCKLGPT